MVSLSKTDKEEESFKIVVFKVGEDFLSCPVSQVQEVIEVEDITPLPDSREDVRGVIDRRGKITTIIDLAKSLDRDVEIPVDESKLIILHHEEKDVGVLVSEVIEIPNISENDIEPVTDETGHKSEEEYMQGIIKRDEDLIVLLDLISLITKKEIKQEEPDEQ